MEAKLFACVLALALGAGCVAGEPVGQGTFAGQQAPPSENFIIGGAPEAGYDAVVAVLYGGIQGCTGTLVNTTFVVTAAHCVEGSSANDMSVFFGSNVSGGGDVIEVIRAVPHPNYNNATLAADIAVLELANPAPGRITPIPYSTTPLTNADVGRQATFVGFGLSNVNQDNSAGIKRSVQIPITQINAQEIIYAAPGRQTCFGDSGGPALLNVGGLERLVGVTSYGDANCADFGANVRTDAFASFLANTIGDDSGSQPSDSGPTPTPPVTDDNTNPSEPDNTPANPPADEVTPGGDFCIDNNFYDDGTCHINCPQPDPDCWIEVCLADGQCYDIPRTAGDSVQPGDGQGPAVDLGAGCTAVPVSPTPSLLGTILGALMGLVLVQSRRSRR
ncbi:MAG: serine protease [Myxococcota bacterium]